MSATPEAKKRLDLSARLVAVVMSESARRRTAPAPPPAPIAVAASTAAADEEEEEEEKLRVEQENDRFDELEAYYMQLEEDDPEGEYLLACPKNIPCVQCGASSGPTKETAEGFRTDIDVEVFWPAEEGATPGVGFRSQLRVFPILPQPLGVYRVLDSSDGWACGQCVSRLHELALSCAKAIGPSAWVR